MDWSTQLCRKMRRTSRRAPLSFSPSSTWGLGIYFYRQDLPPLEYTKGCYTAEDLCVYAAQKCSISPMCHDLFALYNETERMWYPPTYEFKITSESSIKLHYRIRFYFKNWHGTTEGESPVWRHCISKLRASHGTQKTPEGTPLLDSASLDYLFAQGQYDFKTGLVPIRPAQSDTDMLEIENECLGMAVIGITHYAKSAGISLSTASKETSYKQFIPDTLNRIIKQRNFLTRIRINNVFKNFLQEFNDRTVKDSNIKLYDLKVKYLATLEGLTSGLGCELLEPISLTVTQEGELLNGDCYHQYQGLNLDTSGDMQVLVSGIDGISWRKKPSTMLAIPKEKGKPKKNKLDSKSKQTGMDDSWEVFCDFDEITHAVIREANVTIKRQDNKRMELKLASHEEALSFAALVDGYFRLTVDAHHYLCKEVAPASVVQNIEIGCHGPISTEYAIHKLHKEGNQEGTYILRWSCIEYQYIIITVVCIQSDKSQRRPIPQYKNFQIEVGADGFRLYGTDMVRKTLKDLLDHLGSQNLRTEDLHFQLMRCCPPQPGEVSNLLVVTKERAPAPETPMHLSFHRILKDQIKKEQHLGVGTRTNIFSGTLNIKSNEDEDAGYSSFQEVHVVLKVLDSGHRDISLAFFETASMMRQVSHKHIVLLYGVCVHTQNIMVEEFVQLGPLDLFMRRQPSPLSTPWKFQVAKQLASALSYLEDKKLVHGFVCAKNILVARAGLEEEEGGPFIKLSDPGIPITVLNSEEVVHRIPWIAPECVKNVAALSIAADKWGFGTTLWEICYDGEAPLKDKKLTEKECFYQREFQLATPECKELANLMTHCMNYDPKKRRFFRAIVRDLDMLEDQNPSFPRQQGGQVDPTLFEKRFLVRITELGKGHFGMVELCRYDPRGDQTGELVAVKSLKSERGDSNDDEQSDDQSKNLSTEIDILKALYHKNIVKYKGICQEEGGKAIKLIMEYLPLGSLQNYLAQNKTKIPMSALIDYSIQICQGMEYLGSMNYIHRDLAARNVLVENESTVKIGDFGLTKCIKKNEGYYRVTDGTDSPVFWYAPECLSDSKFFLASDVWSFGVTMYELVTYCESTKGPMKMFHSMIGRAHGGTTVLCLLELLRKGHRLPQPEGCPESLYHLMRRCWEETPGQRITFKRLIEELTVLQGQTSPPSDH